jgi:hypothetical protein
MAVVRRTTILPRDRRLSAKLLPTFTDKGCRMVSATDPYGRILGSLDRAQNSLPLKLKSCALYSHLAFSTCAGTDSGPLSLGYYELSIENCSELLSCELCPPSDILAETRKHSCLETGYISILW